MKKSKIIVFGLILLALLIPVQLFAGGEKEAAAPDSGKPFRIGIFVPGVVAGSPLYEGLVSGTELALKDFPNATMKVIEGGFNQGEWQEKVTSMAASMEYDLIVTSNPALPFILVEVAKSFPNQKFLNVDGYYDGHPQIATYLYNQVEQAYFMGYLGGLVTKSNMSGANRDLKLGMVVAQQYPALDRMMRPGYEMGAKAVDPNITIDFRVIGNWYDANKAADLTNSMIDAGADVILTICGGANQGTIKAARDRGKYVLFFDSNEYKLAPGTIIGCGVLYQEKLVREVVGLAIQGRLEYGKAKVVDTRGGYVDFISDDPLYIQAVPAEIRAEMDKMVQRIKSGQLVLEVPKL